ncbi:hypothetical protein EON65_45715, partial [archaeon]
MKAWLLRSQTRSAEQTHEKAVKKARVEPAAENAPSVLKDEDIPYFEDNSEDADVDNHVYHSDISILERARLENIQRNEQLLQELGIVGLR